MLNYKFYAGDIPAISSKGFLPKAIQKFMRIWGKKRYNRTFEKYYNHTMIVTKPKAGEISEAIGRGFVRRKFHSGYPTSVLKDMVIFRLKDPLNAREQKKLLDESKKMADTNIEYEVFNFLWWAVYILTNGKVDWSPKGEKRDDKVFCFETSAMLINKVRPGFFEDPSKVTTVDLEMDSRFEKVYFYKVI